MTDPRREFRGWLEALGLGAHADTFASQDVDFGSLHLLSEQDLAGLGLSLGHRRILQNALAQRQRDVAQPTVAAGVQAHGHAHGAPGTGERRQITVMFCDLVGSSALSVRFDPEDLRNLIHAYYSSCCRIIEESGGFIARLVGDGILAYFGYPAAREDAAECAIRAGLRVIESMRNQRLEGAAGREGDERIDVRIGLATGVSVIGDMVGVGFSELHAVMGQTPNLASRIQGLADPGTVAISDETRRLAGGFFVYADHGLHQVKGFDQPVQAWRVIGESRSGARFDAQHAGHVDCIGRDAQLRTLQGVWGQVRQRGCRIVTLTGEAGIGKSRLLRTASERLDPPPGLTVFMQCAPSQAATPLHPLIDWLRRDTGVGPSDPAGNRARLEAWMDGRATPLDVTLIAELLSVPLDVRTDPQQGEPPPPMPPDRKRQLTRDVVLRHFERHCAAAPGLLMIEDAHWMDGATEQFLGALFERMREHPLMAIVTLRPGRSRSWGNRARVTELTLEPLERTDAQQLVRSACRGRSLPGAVVDEILAKTDGVPLFVEELTAMILESGMLREEGDALVIDGPLPTLDIPSTLRDSLMARLDRLSDIKNVARIASALGREFSFALLAQVSEQPAERLVAALDRLVEAQLLFQRGVPPQAEYVFKHALVQQAAYDSQLRSDRHALHARIVRAIEAHQPDVARREPGLMAHHCEQAGMIDREVDYLVAAGQASTRIVAIPEALSYFERADAAIAHLEPTARNARRNIDVILGMMEVGRFAILPSRLRALGARAKELSQLDGVTCDAAMTAAILFQDGRAKLYSSRYAQARSVFQEIRRLGVEHGSAAIERKPASAFGMDLCCQGLFGEALEYINERNIGWYKQSGSFIDYLAGLGWIAYASCQTGAVDAGMRAGNLVVQEAEHVQSAIYLAGAHVWRSHALMALRRFDEAVADAKQCVALSTEHAVPYLGWHGLVFLALCQCRSGDAEGAAASLEQARALLAQVEDKQWSLLDYLPAIEAEIASSRGDHARAMRCADEAIAVAAPIDGHFAAAIAWRVKALGCLRAGGDAGDAQAFFDRAMQLHEQGGAHAERAFSALVWAHAWKSTGQARESRRWVDVAQALAQRHGFELARCEYGAAAVIGASARPAQA